MTVTAEAWTTGTIFSGIRGSRPACAVREDSIRRSARARGRLSAPPRQRRRARSPAASVHARLRRGPRCRRRSSSAASPPRRPAARDAAGAASTSTRGDARDTRGAGLGGRRSQRKGAASWMAPRDKRHASFGASAPRRARRRGGERERCLRCQHRTRDATVGPIHARARRGGQPPRSRRGPPARDRGRRARGRTRRPRSRAACCPAGWRWWLPPRRRVRGGRRTQSGGVLRRTSRRGRRSPSPASSPRSGASSRSAIGARSASARTARPGRAGGACASWPRPPTSAWSAADGRVHARSIAVLLAGERSVRRGLPASTCTSTTSPWTRARAGAEGLGHAGGVQRRRRVVGGGIHIHACTRRQRRRAPVLQRTGSARRIGAPLPARRCPPSAGATWMSSRLQGLVLLRAPLPLMQAASEKAAAAVGDCTCGAKYDDCDECICKPAAPCDDALDPRAAARVSARKTFRKRFRPLQVNVRARRRRAPIVSVAVVFFIRSFRFFILHVRRSHGSTFAAFGTRARENASGRVPRLSARRSPGRSSRGAGRRALRSLGRPPEHAFVRRTRTSPTREVRHAPEPGRVPQRPRRRRASPGRRHVRLRQAAARRHVARFV